MTAFNPSMIKPASKSAEFATAEQGRTAKSILIDGIAKQIKLFSNPKEDGRRWFVLGQKEVALTLRVNNKPIKLIGDETKVVVPVEQFEAAMNHFRAEVEKGNFNAQLEEADKGIATRREKLRSTRAAKKTATK
ncbi:hypothetical protein [Sphingobium sp. TCM1]|uniref:hypothetical protein n=1 Tax=Sphingobium sp. TCM1 TaxID=453246 RepID=UPI00082FB971|nr:hypothetical protein [Sphingobium sp. TCM1]